MTRCSLQVASAFFLWASLVASIIWTSSCGGREEPRQGARTGETSPQQPVPVAQVDSAGEGKVDTEARADLIQGAKEEVSRVMRKHVDGLRTFAASKAGYSVTEKRWEKLFSTDVMAFTTDAALRMADEAIRDGRHHVVSRSFGAIYVAVSVVPSIDDTEVRALFPGGYFEVLDGLLKESDWLHEDRDFAHWIYCYAGEDKHKAHLTFIPAKSVTNGVWIFAQDLMTSEEKSRAGLQ